MKALVYFYSVLVFFSPVIDLFMVTLLIVCIFSFRSSSDFSLSLESKNQEFHCSLEREPDMLPDSTSLLYITQMLLVTARVAKMGTRLYSIKDDCVVWTRFSDSLFPFCCENWASSACQD